MLTFIAALTILITFAALLLWLGRLTVSSRQRSLQDTATALKGTYAHWHPTLTLRQAGLQLVNLGEARYAQHWCEIPGDSDCTPARFCDFTLMTRTGPHAQTLVIMECPLPLEGRLMISRRRWLDDDVMSPTQGSPMLCLPESACPDRLQGWNLTGSPPHRMLRLLSEEVTDWLLAHHHLHIEWANGILLACQPDYLIEASELSHVLRDVTELHTRLNRTCFSAGTQNADE